MGVTKSKPSSGSRSKDLRAARMRLMQGFKPLVSGRRLTQRELTSCLDGAVEETDARYADDGSVRPSAFLSVAATKRVNTTLHRKGKATKAESESVVGAEATLRFIAETGEMPDRDELTVEVEALLSTAKEAVASGKGKLLVEGPAESTEEDDETTQDTEEDEPDSPGSSSSKDRFKPLFAAGFKPKAVLELILRRQPVEIMIVVRDHLGAGLSNKEIADLIRGEISHLEMGSRGHWHWHHGGPGKPLYIGRSGHIDPRKVFEATAKAIEEYDGSSSNEDSKKITAAYLRSQKVPEDVIKALSGSLDTLEVDETKNRIRAFKAARVIDCIHAMYYLPYDPVEDTGALMSDIVAIVDMLRGLRDSGVKARELRRIDSWHEVNQGALRQKVEVLEAAGVLHLIEGQMLVDNTTYTVPYLQEEVIPQLQGRA